jgi:membrane-bound lytic murein transglycosylase D
MGTGNGREYISVIPFRYGMKHIISIILMIAVAASANISSQAPRRGNPVASWSESSEPIGGPLPSVQSHAGPLMFATFSPDDLIRPQVLEEIERQLSPAYLRGHGGTHARSTLYRDFIAIELQKRRLPPDLITLVFIESAFRIKAESRTGARGLWQFADNSMAPWLRESAEGLAYDERFDFWKSTEAALDKLRQNYEQGDSWLVSIAAYNGGLGRITRAMGEGGLWEIPVGEGEGTISEETADYVPRYIATAFIAAYPGRFGLPLNWSSPFLWERIPVDQGLALEEFASSIGMSFPLLMSGNAEYLSGHIPTGEHWIKVPNRYYADALTYLEDIEASNRHLVMPGDTLWSISMKYGLSLDELQRINGIENGEILKVGVYLRIASRETDN